MHDGAIRLKQRRETESEIAEKKILRLIGNNFSRCLLTNAKPLQKKIRTSVCFVGKIMAVVGVIMMLMVATTRATTMARMMNTLPGLPALLAFKKCEVTYMMLQVAAIAAMSR